MGRTTGSDGHRTRAAGRERGAALVEAAIILPLVLLLTFGTIEFARMYNASSTVAQAARAGGRTASALPTDATMPEKAAAAAAPVLSRMRNAPEELWVYRVRGPAADGRPPAVCGAACVAFSWDDATATFTPVGGDGTWDAGANQVCTGTFDQVGIHVRTNVRYITGLFGSDRTITDWAVFRFEPASQEWCATR